MILPNMLKTSTRYFLKHTLVLAGVIFVGSPVIDFAPMPVQASPNTSHSIYNKQAKGRVPGRRRGGARRGDCPATSTQLTALVPETELSTQALPETYVGGSTTAEYPTFWFYVPYSLSADLTGEFILQDNTGQNIYQIASTDFPAAEVSPGIIGISLPSTIAPLKIGKVYKWYFKLNCGMEAPMYVQGGIERIALNANLAKQLANATPTEQANLYIKNNAWYDAVNVIAKVYRTNPTDNNTKSAWINLLRAIDLESF
ncbi:DUF928 domain-containing protein [Aliterella atlantica]|uniref:DUF928 domain-containing protein n=1 Tax=Aliterella atlantica TaxID=1827278 RepID=UPI0006961379|nr:DUF928 domain-containing protein [Aliterella atlantica]